MMMIKKFRLSYSVTKFYKNKKIHGGQWHSPSDFNLTDEEIRSWGNVEIKEDKVKKDAVCKDTKKEEKIKSEEPELTIESLEMMKEKMGWSEFRKWAKEEYDVVDRSFNKLCSEIMDKVNKEC
jgi:hypothetical protein